MSVRQSWADAELSPWRGVALDGLLARLNAAIDAEPVIALYTVEDGQVRIGRLDLDRVPERKRGMIEQRSRLYLAFIQEATTTADLRACGPIAMRLDDRGPHLVGTPIFGFQKRRFESTLLLPDVDLLGQDLLAAADHVPYGEKRPEGVFVGSTTGGLLTSEVLAADAHIRIRSAQFFANKPGVTFLLPNVVQCDNEETASRVRSLGLGDRIWSWEEQMRYRYLLSIDGNGATCSRVVRALASNSALVKYSSAHLLYYFHGLEPWIHFIPVARDSEVLALVEQAATTVTRDQQIATEGQHFARSHLGRAQVVEYSAALLRGYAELTSDLA